MYEGGFHLDEPPSPSPVIGTGSMLGCAENLDINGVVVKVQLLKLARSLGVVRSAHKNVRNQESDGMCPVEL